MWEGPNSNDGRVDLAPVDGSARIVFCCIAIL